MSRINSIARQGGGVVRGSPDPAPGRTERLAPVRFYEYRVSYPPAFADLFHWESQAGQAVVYRVQPRTWEPWQGATDPHAIFVPGRLACGGD